MGQIKDLKCKCCRCYDSFDGCTAFDCNYDFELSIDKIKGVAEDYGISVADVAALLKLEEGI